MGTRAFLFTDIEGSTKLWSDYPTLMPEALARHDDLITTRQTTEASAVLARQLTGAMVHLGAERKCLVVTVAGLARLRALYRHLGDAPTASYTGSFWGARSGTSCLRPARSLSVDMGSSSLGRVLSNARAQWLTHAT